MAPEQGRWQSVGLAVQHGQAERGIVIRGSGVGAAVAANKVSGVRAAWGPFPGARRFQRPMKEGVFLLNTVQDLYLCNEITVA